MSADEADPLLERDWGPLLEDEFRESYWGRMWSCIDQESRSEVYPPPGDVFRALLLTPHVETKVVILGQYPYPRACQADGLCFSVRPGVASPPSLRNIRLELQEEGFPVPSHGSLEAWAHRGVLLLNTALTVSSGTRGSHLALGWGTFTDRVISVVNSKRGSVVFLLWGDVARAKRRLIDDRHVIISSSHPSPPSAYRGRPPFRKNKPFSKANTALRARGVAEGRLGSARFALPSSV